MNTIAFYASIATAFALGLLFGYEMARQRYVRIMSRFEREFEFLRAQLRDREHPA